MPARHKKDSNPVVFKLGVALTLSLAAFLCSRLRNKHARLSLPPSPPPADGNEYVHSTPTPTSPTCPDPPSFSEEPHPVILDDSSNSSPSTITSPVKYDQDIKRLRSLVKDLRGQERMLENQLLEYYGLKELEKTAMELQSRLKISRVEARALSLKVQSLQEENRRLAVGVADYVEAMDELQVSKAKIEVLGSRLHFGYKQNKDHISRLLQRVVRLEDHEVGRLKNEATRLRKANEKLANDVERLRSDRCSDVVELVYLRWVNACLRATVSSRDLSKSMSLKSEAQAKQLIHDYANQEENNLEYSQRT